MFDAAVIGLGRIGLGYDLSGPRRAILTHTKAFLKHPSFNLCFGIDPDPARRKAFEAFAKRPAFASLSEAVKHTPRLDVASVCVQPEHREEIADALVPFKPKVLILEKPLGYTATEANRFLRRCQKKGYRVCVNYLRRFDPYTETLKKSLDQRRDGPVDAVTVYYNGGFLNNGSHWMDLLMALFGSPKGFRLEKKRKTGKDWDVDCFIYYPGFDVFFKCLRCAAPIGEMHIRSRRGAIEYRRFGFEVKRYTLRQDAVYPEYAELAYDSFQKTGLAKALHHMVDHVARFLRNETRLFSDDRTALRTQRLCNAILRS